MKCWAAAWMSCHHRRATCWGDQLLAMVREACEREGLERREYRFTRRQVRETTCWGDTQLKMHLARLVELEYLLIHRKGQTFCYELAYAGDWAAMASAFWSACWTRNTCTMASGRGLKVSGRPSVGVWSGCNPVGPWSRARRMPSKASNGSASSELIPPTAENANTGTENLPASNPSPTSAPARSLCSLAAEVAKAKPLRATLARTARRA